MGRPHSRIAPKITLSTAMMLIAAAAFAAEPPATSSPTTPPASTPSPRPPASILPAETISRWLDDLADADSSVRDVARENLLGMRREQLGVLRELVQRRSPLDPAQSAALRDIVIHAYLADDPYPRNPQSGFLGVMLGQMRQGVIAPDASAVEPGMSVGAGVIIKECMPGFCGYRFLRAGDVVLGVGASVGAGVDVGPMVRTPAHLELISIVSSTRPGETLIFHVLRQGRLIDIPIQLDARPRAADDRFAMGDPALPRPDAAAPDLFLPDLVTGDQLHLNAGPGPARIKFATEGLIRRRQSKAEAYWQAAFAILLEERLI